MDLILSLPIVSYFLAPSVASWSTSLNLIFFYMTWSVLVLSHSALKIELIGLFALRLALWLAPSLLFLAFDTLLPSVAASLKVGGASSLPSAQKNSAQLLRTFALTIFNLALSAGLEAAVTMFWCYAFGGPVFKTSTTLPLPWQLVKHLALLLAGREVLTYYIHSGILHAKSSNPVAKWHAEYAHSRRTPLFSLLLFADHPVPFLLHRFAPMYLPAMAVRPHLLVYLIHVALCTGEETLATSGYSVVPGIIMGGIARRTAAHYASGGSGNYGAWGLLDWLHGTTRGQDVMGDMKDEAEKHAVKERGEKAATNGLSVVKEGIDGLKKGGRGRPKKAKAEKEKEES
ncbi:hypothetical protein ACRALDRAFT_210349 [Sodiomyces alcalophilus JCM 7366]|uniref:uncharacterized protein n=1 Tax=Sodiomyces alcalophilus JCM 7366 TaxID=591952 RepID=UPI0039B5E730